MLLWFLPLTRVRLGHAIRMNLPPGQHRILTFFADAEDQGRQASRAEVAEELGYAFPSAVTKHVEALVRKGLMIADRDKKRNVVLTDAGWASLNRTPLRLGVSSLVRLLPVRRFWLPSTTAITLMKLRLRLAASPCRCVVIQ